MLLTQALIHISIILKVDHVSLLTQTSLKLTFDLNTCFLQDQLCISLGNEHFQNIKCQGKSICFFHCKSDWQINLPNIRTLSPYQESIQSLLFAILLDEDNLLYQSGSFYLSTLPWCSGQLLSYMKQLQWHSRFLPKDQEFREDCGFHKYHRDQYIKVILDLNCGNIEY